MDPVSLKTEPESGSGGSSNLAEINKSVDIPRTTPFEQSKPSLKLRGGQGGPCLRPVQVRPSVMTRLPPLIRINPDAPPPPRLTFGGRHVRPVNVVQRPIGSPGNLSGVVNVIPCSTVLNASTKISKEDIQTQSSPSGLGVGNSPNLPTAQEALRALNRISSTPPQLTSLKGNDTTPRSSLHLVRGIRNVTPIESGPMPSNLRPVQVRASGMHQMKSTESRRNSTQPLLQSATESGSAPQIADSKKDRNGDDFNNRTEMSIKQEMAEKFPKDHVTVQTNNDQEQAKPSLQSRFVRRADGKGFIRRNAGGGSKRGNSLLKLHKKKKKPFRGCNYRFDGSSIKKRVVKKSVPAFSDVDATEQQGKLAEPTSVLSYLGIQPKSPEDEKSNSNVVLPMHAKAKKSFRPNADLEPKNSDESLSSSTEFVITSERKRCLETANKSSSKENFSKRQKRQDPPTLGEPKEEKVLECVCECNLDTTELISVSKGSQLDHCQAVESIGVSRVGCRNPVADDYLRRSGTTLVHLQLCSVHISRLRQHHACAYCGQFCAHGNFLMCRPLIKSHPHLFHLSCYAADRLKRCPHCHSEEKPLNVLLKLSMKKMPITLLNTYAKMTVSKPDFASTPETRKIVSVEYTLPSGQVISSEGLPPGMDDKELELVISALENNEILKHTTRSVLTPTKQGDNVRLIQLLSLGYSINQKFSECDGGTLLHVAASKGHVLTCHILKQVGAEIDEVDDNQFTPLMLASAEGKPDAVKYLLFSGADVSLPGDDGMTCLHLAAQNGHLECVHVILNHSKLPKKFINAQDEGGWTPLVWACENKHEDVIRYLLENGANPFITDVEGNTALHWAALSGSVSSCELLLNYGCDVNATNSLGESPMHIVLRQDHYECAVLCLMRSARLDIKNHKGQTPPECMQNAKNLKCKMIVQLTSSILNLMKDAKVEEREKILCNDLTRGKESIPIQVVNGLDEAPPPADYVYITRNCQTTFLPINRNIAALQHCQCDGDCSSENSCNCADQSIMSWYGPEGHLKEEFFGKNDSTPTIYECNDMCSCHLATCQNRVLQHGITIRLQVFRTLGMGWGVRALSDIPKGAFVCEYIGELISDSEAETREDTYLFDLDNHGETFCIDANRFGNIARFINHSCNPNLTPVKVLTDHQDLRFPHMALFANRFIPKGEELGFDYGEKFWVIKHKFFTCHCGSEKCKYSKTRINSFLVEYYKRIKEPLPEEILERTKEPKGLRPKDQDVSNGEQDSSACRSKRGSRQIENGKQDEIDK